MQESLPQLILPIKLERSPERLTSLGGLVVLEELARAAGVWEKVDRRVEGPKSGRGYQPHEFVQPLVWMLHAGGRRLEDLRELRAEQQVLERLGLESVPDAGTVGDWLRRQGRAGAERMQRVSQELVAAGLQEESEELTLDVDAMEIEAEKQEAAWTYNKVKGYMPMLGYVNGVCVGHEFREGHESPGAGIVEFAQDCEAALPEGKRIYFRSMRWSIPPQVVRTGRSSSYSKIRDVDGCLAACRVAHCGQTSPDSECAESLAQDFSAHCVDHDIGAITLRDPANPVAKLLHRKGDHLVENPESVLVAPWHD